MKRNLQRISTALFRLLTLKHHPYEGTLGRDVAFFATEDRTIIVAIVLDYVDHDYNAIILGRDDAKRYRSFWVDVSLATIDEAVNAAQKFIDNIPADKTTFSQGDENDVFDIFTPVAQESRLNDFFKFLNLPQNSPAKEAIREIAYIFKDKDGNFIQQFQTTGFNARLFELYMFAFLHEAQFIVDDKSAYPDFVFSKGKTGYALECTTVNPGKNDIDRIPQNLDELDKLERDYFPIKFGSALYSKLNHTTFGKHYWELPHVVGKPFIIAIADFHIDGIMCLSSPAIERYLYGYEYSVGHDQNGSIIQIPHKIKSFDWASKHIDSSFFDLPESENISAVLFTNAATVAKFNRMGKIAGMGRSDVKIIRHAKYYNNDPRAVTPITVVSEVTEKTCETWAEGAIMYHNPRAKIHIPSEDFEGIAHCFFEKDKRTYHIVPSRFPLNSITKAYANKGAIS